jgi:leucyl/phenylalanyl-tRNA---protein transferase
MPVFFLSDALDFPPVHLATAEGLLAVGGDLSAGRLLLAYRCGIFPWFSDDNPILWWSPDPRLVLFPAELKVSRSLKRTLRKGRFKVTRDADFARVIGMCAGIRIAAKEGTWITSDMVKAYIRLHDLGYAHSVETWYQDKIVGGLYGVSLGRCFFGESMFSTMSDASKVALVCLRDYLQSKGFDFIDCQMPTAHLINMGAREITRRRFMALLDESLQHPTLKGRWTEA